jgi:hypothetical protein
MERLKGETTLGNPNTGEIYEGALRDPGDVPLTEAQAEMLRSLPLRSRIDELQSLRDQMRPAPLTDEAKAELIAESMRKIDPPSDAQPELVRLVTAALEARNFKPRCSQCSSIGWARTYVHPVPMVSQSMTGEVIATALLVCGKCGAQREYNLNVLGIIVTPQERRVITPDQPLIVTG